MRNVGAGLAHRRLYSCRGQSGRSVWRENRSYQQNNGAQGYGHSRGSGNMLVSHYWQYLSQVNLHREKGLFWITFKRFHSALVPLFWDFGANVSQPEHLAEECHGNGKQKRKVQDYHCPSVSWRPYPPPKHHKLMSKPSAHGHWGSFETQAIIGSVLRRWSQMAESKSIQSQWRVWECTWQSMETRLTRKDRLGGHVALKS